MAGTAPRHLYHQQCGLRFGGAAHPAGPCGRAHERDVGPKQIVRPQPEGHGLLDQLNPAVIRTLDKAGLQRLLEPYEGRGLARVEPRRSAHHARDQLGAWALEKASGTLVREESRDGEAVGQADFTSSCGP